MKTPKRLQVRQQLKRCPSCGYRDGFHLMFRRVRGQKGTLRAFLICPMCSAVHDIGLQLQTTEAG